MTPGAPPRPARRRGVLLAGATLAALSALPSATAGDGAPPPPAARVLQAHGDLVRSVVWSADGKTLATAGFDGAVSLWDGTTLANRATRPTDGGKAYWVSLSKDRLVTAAGLENGNVRVWTDRPGSEATRDLVSSATAAWAGALTPDGDRLVSGGPDGALAFWSTRDGHEIRRVRARNGIGAIDVSADGRLAAVATSDGFLTLYETRTGEAVRSFGNCPGGAYALAFSRDGSTLASAGGDAAARVWRVADGSLVARLPTFSAVRSVALSPDGRSVAVGEEDFAVKVWDAATGTYLAKFTGAAGVVWSLAYSPDGARLACAVADGTVLVWEPGPDLAPAAPSLPPKADLRPTLERWGLGVVAQHSRGTCSLHTMTRAIEFALSRREGRGVPLSDEYLNWACNQVIGNVGPTAVDRGQFFEHSWMGYVVHGICRRERMPWKDVFDPAYAPSPEAVADAAALRRVAFSWREVTGAGVPDAEVVRRAKAVLVAGWPLLAGSHHSLLVVGYEDDPRDPGGGRFVVEDSGTGGFVDTVRADRFHTAIAYARVGDYGFGWVQAHDPFPRVGAAGVAHR